MRQLTFDGWEVEHPPKLERHLTSRQRELLRIVRASSQPFSTRFAGRFYRDPSGVLRRLEELGLVERVRRGYWRAT